MRSYSLAYLTASASSVAGMIGIAAEVGYGFVGLRLWPNAPGAPHQALIGRPDLLKEAVARLQDSAVRVFDLEIIRIGEQFDPVPYRPLLEAGAMIQARAVLVAADDSDESRLADHYAGLCEFMQPYGLTADLEFMPWTGVKDARAALRVLTRAGRPANAGILVDALHFARSTTTLEDIAAIPREWLHYAQICDAPGGPGFSTEQLIHTARNERLLPGEGVIDLPGLFGALPGDLPVSVEIPHHVRAAKLGDLAWARQALAAARGELGDAPA